MLRNVESAGTSSTSIKGEMGAWAPYYDGVMTLMTFGQERRLREMTLGLVPVGPGDKVLEVGCGTGTLSIAAKEQVGSLGEVVGIDASQEVLDIARYKAAKAGMQIAFQRALMEELPYPDAQFDVVLSSFMILHLPGDDRIRQGVDEVYRVLRPRGRLLVIDAASLKPKLPRLMEQAGFTNIELGRRWMLLSFVRGIAAKPA